ncbi:MAG: radical SAM family heme chaperone HemW, partial [Cyclobacteriaceae bacterium]|nr:radical SAM family heme chaperone HemW [Cyclobacteriaceae bacterium]
FCKQACHYCDFHFSTSQDYRTKMCEAIATEIKLQANYLDGELIETIYWGGGTPSLLSANELTIIFNAIHKHFNVHKKAEITLEANPDDLTKQKLQELHLASINRLSIGIQSFDDATLRFFNRAHTRDEALLCVADAREVGFGNLSLDLIYSIPGRASTIWENDLFELSKLQPEHVSAYSLTIEDKTVFGKWERTGKINPVNEAKSISDFESLIQHLVANGYEHYEISNFSKPGFVSRHNSNYWKQQKYLGVGPSAHSYNGVSRQFTVSNNHEYMKALDELRMPFEREVLTRENKINEYIFTSLRTMWGCDLMYLKSNHNYSLENFPALGKTIELQLAVLKENVLSLTPKGKLLADQIATDLFV